MTRLPPDSGEAEQSTTITHLRTNSLRGRAIKLMYISGTDTSSARLKLHTDNESINMQQATRRYVDFIIILIKT